MASKLLRTAAHEAENQTELSLREAFVLLQHQLKPPFSLKIPSPSEYKQLNRAILFGLLTEPHMARIHITYLHAIVTDGYAFFVDLLLKISNELYPKLLESVRVQLLWIVSKMVDVLALGIDVLLISLLRQIVGGDLSFGNLWLCEELLRVFRGNWDSLLEEQPLVLTSAVYTYLRLLADHYRLSGSSKLEALKHLEIDFCVRALRKNFNLCFQIGRDLIRLLQDLVHIPEFRDIWKDLLFNPVEFSHVPGFSDISQLYCSRTSSRYFLLRVTLEMETQLRFLLTHVRWGSQKRYQAWFAKKFLCGSERETLIIDLVRFICCALHPSNEIIQSDVIQRWAIIGWLLKCCRKNHVEANVKLALFYDWLFFDERVDKIMNIEPGILLMVNSIPKYIDMTHNLLEFLFLLMDNYDVERTDIIVRGVSTAFGVLVQKGVVRSLDTLISCSALAPSLRERLVDICSRFKMGISKELHPASLPLPTSSFANPSKVKDEILLVRDLKRSTWLKGNALDIESVHASGSVSDDIVTNCSPLPKHDENLVVIIEKLVQNLGETIKSSNIRGLKCLEEILISFAKLDDHLLGNGGSAMSYSVLSPEILAHKITEAFKSNGYKIFAPFECPRSGLKFSDDIQSATASIMRNFIFSQQERMQNLILFWSRNGFPVGAHLLFYASQLAYEAQLRNSLQNPQGSANVHGSAEEIDLEVSLLKFHEEGFVNFMSHKRKNSLGSIVCDFRMDEKLVTKMVDGTFAAYRCFLTLLRNSLNKEADMSLANLLFSDTLSCCQWAVERKTSLVCSIFSHLSDISTGEEDIIRLIVDQLDYADLLVVQLDVGLKKFSVFGGDTEIISHLVKSSLNWGSEKQQKFWNLIRSELAVSNVQVEKLIIDLCRSSFLDPNLHAVAVGGLFTLCSCRAPTPELVHAIVSLPENKFRDFAAAVLASWVVSNASMLFNSLANSVEKISTSKEEFVKMNHSSILCSWNFLDMQDIKSINFLKKLSVEFPEIKSKLADAAAL